MRLKLTVTHAETDALVGTHVFEQDVVRIGRASDNDLALDDPTTVVSKYHAAVRRAGDGFTVEDLGSKNFTFLNGDRVASSPRPLHRGDRLDIGPFRVAVEIERAAPAPSRDLEQTVFAAGFSNPFTEEAEALAEAFGRLRRSVFSSGYPRRDDALGDALREAFGPGGDAEALLSVVRGEASAVRPSAPLAPPATPPPSATPPAWEAPPADAPAPWGTPPPQEAPAPSPSPGFWWEQAAAPLPASDDDDDPTASRPPAPPGTFQTPAPAPDPWASPDPRASAPPTPLPAPLGAAAGASGAGAGAGLPDDVAIRVLRVTTRLLGIPWQFRHEFIGQTILHTPETAFLYDGDAAALWRFLQNPATRAERLAVLEDAAEQAVIHQVAMLDGYRAATERGAGALLDALDPAALEEEPAGNAVGRLLSAVKGGGALADRLRQRLEELRAEGPTVLERRYFRPAYIDAYLERLAGHRPPPSF